MPDLLPIEGPVKYYKDFRRFLLSRNPLFPREKFALEKDQFPNLGWTFRMIPAQVHKWVTQSKRVYKLTADMQQFLETASVESISWSDVTFPFDSFCISLPIPLVEDEVAALKDERFDTLLVHIERISSDETLFGITVLPEKIENFRLPSKNLIDRIEDCIQNRRFDKANVLINEVDASKFNLNAHGIMLKLQSPEQHISPLMGILATAARQPSEGWKEISPNEQKCPKSHLLVIRIVIGLCLYLESTTRRRIKDCVGRAVRTDVPTVPDVRTITQEAHICDVSYEHFLSANDKKLFELIRTKGLKEAIREMGTHFRCAYWRRAPGHGDDPEAEKTVHVKSTMVRRDRLPESGLPPGSQVKVT